MGKLAESLSIKLNGEAFLFSIFSCGVKISLIYLHHQTNQKQEIMTDLNKAKLVSSEKVEIFGIDYEKRKYLLPSPYNHHTVRLAQNGELLDAKRTMMLLGSK